MYVAGRCPTLADPHGHANPYWETWPQRCLERGVHDGLGGYTMRHWVIKGDIEHFPDDTPFALRLRMPRVSVGLEKLTLVAKAVAECCLRKEVHNAVLLNARRWMLFGACSSTIIILRARR